MRMHTAIAPASPRGRLRNVSQRAAAYGRSEGTPARRARPVIFLDDGGVMNDNARRQRPWEQGVAAFFAPRLGREPDAWERANRASAGAIFAEWDAWLARHRDADYRDFQRVYAREWLGRMLDLLDLPRPGDAEMLRLYAEATAFVTRRVQAAIPGAVEAIQQLRAAGYVLGTASAEESFALDGYLSAMGVRDCFAAGLYGPDLVGVLKAGRGYYERVFADAAVDPADALVVDDGREAVAWARAAGARAIRVGDELGSLADLPALLRRTVASPDV
jgi:beta-phosphoglucomutase-like phosphatase (HAD superfamily)